LRPTLSATLLTGAGELALGGGRSKLPGRYLAPYLTAHGAREVQLTVDLTAHEPVKITLP
jgi:hypothetical protein